MRKKTCHVCRFSSLRIKRKRLKKMKNLNWNLIDCNSSQTLRGIKQKRENDIWNLTVF